MKALRTVAGAVLAMTALAAVVAGTAAVASVAVVLGLLYRAGRHGLRLLRQAMGAGR